MDVDDTNAQIRLDRKYELYKLLQSTRYSTRKQRRQKYVEFVQSDHWQKLTQCSQHRCPQIHNIPHGAQNPESIVQMDLDNNFIRIWNTAAEIHRQVGFQSGNVVRACRANHKTAYGFKWRLATSEEKNKLL